MEKSKRKGAQKKTWIDIPLEKNIKTVKEHVSS